MKDLIDYIVKGITASDDFEIEQSEEEGREIYEIKAGKDSIGKIIGRGGSTIKAIRNIVKAKAILDKKAVFVNVSEK